MKRWLLALLLAGCAALASAADPEPPAAKQVMVMLHLPAPHFRADANYGGAYQHDGGRSARRAIALELARAHGLQLVADWPMPALSIDCYVMALPAGADPAKVATELANDSRVEWAQPVASFHGLGAGDALYPVQPAATAWHLDELHQASTGADVRVAVIDSGVDQRHPSLAGQLAAQENFIDGQPYVAENHGTAVAGIIAASGGHGGIVGIAPSARIMALRACSERAGQGAQCNSYSLGKALNFAIMHEAHVINLSLSGPPDRLLQRLLDAAQQRGIKVVGASDPQSADGGFPASWPGVFAVGDESGLARAALRAPGHDIPTAAPGARWSFVSGSSYAAAHVSGLLALMDQIEPAASSATVRAQLQGRGLVKVGSGAAVDACAALSQAAARCVCACAVAGGVNAKALHVP